MGGGRSQMLSWPAVENMKMIFFQSQKAMHFLLLTVASIPNMSF